MSRTKRLILRTTRIITSGGFYISWTTGPRSMRRSLSFPIMVMGVSMIVVIIMNMTVILEKVRLESHVWGPPALVVPLPVFSPVGHGLGVQRKAKLMQLCQLSER